MIIGITSKDINKEMITGITSKDINSFCKKLRLDPEHLIILAPSYNIIAITYILDEIIFVIFISDGYDVDGYTLSRHSNKCRYFFEEDDKQFIIENLTSLHILKKGDTNENK